jgi:putative SOS response-associated peptidase YedK
VCFSARVQADYRQYLATFGAKLSFEDFYDLFHRRLVDPKTKIPKAMAASFGDAMGDEGRIRPLIEQFEAAQAAKLEADMFKQRRRLADAQRSLKVKTTKKALEEQRIATDKIGQLLAWHADLHRQEALPQDSRIFPLWYAPVMVWEAGQRVIKPMRYGCRPAGKPASYDVQYPGTYNARRDNLQGFWKAQFGHTHGLVVVSAFYENVARHQAEGRQLAPGEAAENRVLEFRPRPTQDMLVACLWSKWTRPGEPDLLSFAAITDEPPPEIAAAGHDRCIIPIQAAHIDAWLNPSGASAQQIQAILDDRARPYYEHRLAA